MMYGYYSDFVGHTILGGFFMIVFWVAVVSFIIWAIKTSFDSKDEVKPRNAMDILKERYAKGSITKEEFESIKKDLSS